MRLSVIVPAYNEASTIRAVVARLRELPIDAEVICVDDGSTDGTTEILRTLEPQVAAVVYQRPNQGKGAAILAGLQRVTRDAVVIQDADLELDPFDFLRLLPVLERNPGCVVYGTRFRGPTRPLPRLAWFANRFLTLLTNLLFDARLTDMETAYKMFPRQVLCSLSLRCRGFEFEPEVTARLLLAGVRIREVPVSYEPRTSREGKKIGWRDGLKAMVWLLRCRFAG